MCIILRFFIIILLLAQAILSKYNTNIDYCYYTAGSYADEYQQVDPEKLRRWKRHPGNPVYRDKISGYEVASDSHVFIDTSNKLRMVYTGIYKDHPSVMLAEGSALDTWEKTGLIISGETHPEGESSGKETPFYFYNKYRKKHQIYYIAYEDEDPYYSYESEIFMAEADSIEGPYRIGSSPVVPKGKLAGEDVHMMTSPSILEFQGKLYMVFIAWNAPPVKTTMVWVMGTVSSDWGKTWSQVQKVDVPIGMEGQLTMGPDDMFYATSTREYKNTEAVFLSRSSSPFGPYDELHTEPILIKAGPPLETDEITAVQIFFRPVDKKVFIYYTGADYRKGYWVMAASADY